MRKLSFTALGLLFAAPVFASIVDGTAEAGYGAALFVQQNTTQFGNSTSGLATTANGSEIDGVYAKNDGSTLSAVVTGNLESNFNKYVVFIDSKAGGFNTISNTNASSDDFGWLNGNASGLTFDSGFNADYALWVRHDATNTFLSFAELGAGGDLISSGFATGSLLTSGTSQFQLNNSNVGGVTGGAGEFSSPDGAGVLTGFEFQFDLATLGATGLDTIKLAGFVNSGGNFMSNQVIGGLPAGTGNLATTGAVNFGGIAGDQFVSVTPVPEPGTLAVLGLGLLAARKRRK